MPFAAFTRKSLIPGVFDFEPKTFGRHILRRRLSRGQTQQAAANTLGVSPATLLNWEKGKTQPAPPALPAIRAFLGYDPFPVPTTLVERLQAARRGFGWSIAEAARQMRVDEGTWRAWEAGQTILYHKDRERIAELLNVPITTIQEEMAKRWSRSHTRKT